MSSDEHQQTATGEAPSSVAVAETMRRMGEGEAWTGYTEAARALVDELHETASRGAPVTAETPLLAAASFGHAAAEQGVTAASMARQIGRLACSLEDTLEERGLLAPALRPYLRQAADEAAARAIEAQARWQVARRDDWLSFYIHEMRNRLNTIVNALWLLRNADKGDSQVQRVCDIADRAARRLETLIKDAREMETQFGTTPPTRPKP